MKTETRTARWMVVDDDGHVLQMLGALLRQFHPEVECFNSPQTALTAFAAAPDIYELVFTDYEMPEMNGIELCRRLRELAAELKVLMVTGSGIVTDAIASTAGLTALLSKPFRIQALHEALGKAGAEVTPSLPSGQFHT